MYKFFLFFLIFIINIYFSVVYADYYSYIYSENSVNIISNNQVNAIEFPIPIVQVNSPSGQFNKNNKSVSYVNNNKTMLFYLPERENDIQFMVTLKNGRALSLNFKGVKSKGKIIRIPEYLSGNINKKNNHQNFDIKIKNIMQSAFLDINMDDKWIKTKEFYDNNHKNIYIKKYTEWNNVLYKIIKWDFCSNSKNILFIDYKKFYNNNKILAVTLSKNKLIENECAKLIVLSCKYNNNVI